jgi:hypothetical protein
MQRLDASVAAYQALTNDVDTTENDESESGVMEENNETPVAT